MNRLYRKFTQADITLQIPAALFLIVTVLVAIVTFPEYLSGRYDYYPIIIMGMWINVIGPLAVSATAFYQIFKPI